MLSSRRAATSHGARQPAPHDIALHDMGPRHANETVRLVVPLLLPPTRYSPKETTPRHPSTTASSFRSATRRRSNPPARHSFTWAVPTAPDEYFECYDASPRCDGDAARYRSARWAADSAGYDQLQGSMVLPTPMPKIASHVAGLPCRNFY